MRSHARLLPSCLPCLLLSLVPGQTTESLRGTVVDALGYPVPAVDVWAVDDEGREIARTRADGIGAFLLPDPAGAARAVRATAAGTVVGRAEVVPGRPDLPVPVRLWHAGNLAGRVLDEQGAPIAGAHVVALFARSQLFENWAQAAATTDDEGRFRCANVPLGMVDVRAMAEGFVYGTTCVEVAGDATAELRLRRGEGTSVSVRVHGLDAERAASVRIRMECQGPVRHVVLPDCVRFGRLDAQGSWRVHGLPPFGFRLSVRCPEHAFTGRKDRLFEQPDDPLPWAFGRVVGSNAPQAHAADFDATRSASRPGRLADHAGRPVAGQRVVLADGFGFQAEATSDDNGRFAIAVPRPGAEVRVWTPGGHWTPAEALDKPLFRIAGKALITVPADGTLDLRVVRSAHVVGRVADHEGVPVAGVTVVLAGLAEQVHLSMPLWQEIAAAVSDGDGRFSFSGVPPLHSELRVELALPDEPAPSDPFGAAPAETVDVGTLVRASGALLGVVRDAAGQPIAGAQVRLRGELQDRAQRAATFPADLATREVISARDGRFRFPVVTAGASYRVRAEHAGVVGDEATVTVTAGEEKELPLTVRVPR